MAVVSLVYLWAFVKWQSSDEGDCACVLRCVWSMDQEKVKAMKWNGMINAKRMHEDKEWQNYNNTEVGSTKRLLNFPVVKPACLGSKSSLQANHKLCCWVKFMLMEKNCTFLASLCSCVCHSIKTDEMRTEIQKPDR